MSWEGIMAITAIVTVLVSLVAQAIVLAYFAGKFVTRIDTQNQIFDRFEKTYEKQLVDDKKTDIAMWERIDEYEDKISDHHTRISILEKNQPA